MTIAGLNPCFVFCARTGLEMKQASFACWPNMWFGSPKELLQPGVICTSWLKAAAIDKFNVDFLGICIICRNVVVGVLKQIVAAARDINRKDNYFYKKTIKWLQYTISGATFSDCKAGLRRDRWFEGSAIHGFSGHSRCPRGRPNCLVWHAIPMALRHTKSILYQVKFQFLHQDPLEGSAKKVVAPICFEPETEACCNLTGFW